MASAHPSDRTTFPDKVLPRLRAAVDELSWLLGRGYSEDAAATLVGNRHQLDVRQRMAVRRCACSDAAAAERRARRRETFDGAIAVDGFNQLVTIERALAGGALLRGRDSALRDIASVHGTWRKSERTGRAIDLFCALFSRDTGELPQAQVVWILDAPVSNSGRLAELLRTAHPRFQVEVVGAADRRLAEWGAVGAAVATSDGALLDRCPVWMPLAEQVLASLPVSGEGAPWIVDLSGDERWPSE